MALKRNMIANEDTTLVDPVRRTTRSYSPVRLVRLICVRPLVGESKTASAERGELGMRARSVSWILVLAVGASGVLLSGERQKAPMGTDELVTTQLVADLDRCAREKNLERFLSYSLEDIVALGPDEPAVVGKAAVRAWYERFYAAFDIEMTHHPIETHSFGDIVVTRGDGRGTLRPTGGGPAIPLDNKYLFVLKRQGDGSLKVWRVMYNANGRADAGAAK